MRRRRRTLSVSAAGLSPRELYRHRCSGLAHCLRPRTFPQRALHPWGRHRARVRRRNFRPCLRIHDVYDVAMLRNTPGHRRRDGQGVSARGLPPAGRLAHTKVRRSGLLRVGMQRTATPFLRRQRHRPPGRSARCLGAAGRPVSLRSRSLGLLRHCGGPTHAGRTGRLCARTARLKSP